MAVLRSITKKEKEYFFKAYGNNELKNPASVIFSRFPLPDEIFPFASQKSILESDEVKNFDNTLESREKLVESLVNQLVENITANRFDHERFLKETVDHFKNLIYEDKLIRKVEEFLKLPEDAVIKIARELYNYSRTEDEFSMDEKKS
jgi:hypothetical protein